MMDKIATREDPPSGGEMPAGETEYAARYRRARTRVRAVRDFYTHLGAYFVVNLFLFGINMLTNASDLWFYWPLMGWGVAIAIHAMVTFGPLAATGSSWEERMILEYMEKDRWT